MAVAEHRLQRSFDTTPLRSRTGDPQSCQLWVPDRILQGEFYGLENVMTINLASDQLGRRNIAPPITASAIGLGLIGLGFFAIVTECIFN